MALIQHVDCRWCSGRHTARFLCDPAKQVLDALYAKGMEGNMPTIDFPAPIPMAELAPHMGLNPTDKLVQQFVIKAAIGQVAGVPRPVLIFTGRDHEGGVLPQWLFMGDDDDMQRTLDLIVDRGQRAMQAAAVERGRRG